MTEPFSACIIISAPLERPEDLAVVGEEDAFVRHEQLEARNALRHELVHRGQRRVLHVGEDLVESVVDCAVSRGLLVPQVVLVERVLIGVLGDEVDNGGRAADRGGPGAGLERVAGVGAAERHLHVRVRVDAAGDDVLAARVDDGVCGRRQVGCQQLRARLEHGGDRRTVDEHVGPGPPRRADDGAAGDEGPHRSSYGFVMLVYDSGRRSR
jgi:hypothetical protein